MKLFEPYLISKDGRNDWCVWNDYRENLLASCTVVVGMIGEQKNTGKTIVRRREINEKTKTVPILWGRGGHDRT